MNDPLLNDILDKLIEECSEIILAACKIKAFGLYSHWDGVSNRDALVQEIADLIGVEEVLFTQTELTVSDEELNMRADAKIEKLAIYHPHFFVNS